MAMTLKDLAQVTGTQIRIEFPDFKGNWMCSLHDTEVKDGPMLGSPCGRGLSPQQAMGAYVPQIRGRRLVVAAMSKDRRREFDVPTDLEA